MSSDHIHDVATPINPLVISRKEAKDQGLKRYYTGVPCKRGHLTERRTSTASCIECASMHSKAWEQNNAERERKRRAEYYIKNKEHHAAVTREWARRNAVSLKAYSAQWYAENRERKLAMGRKWHAENKESVASRKKKYAEENRARIKAKQIEWREANQERLKESSKRYYQENRDSATARTMKRRALTASAEGTHNGEDIKRILEAQRHKCAYCGISLKKGYHVDHIVALSKGGSNWPSNLQCLCPKCNLSKGAKDPIDFAQEKGRLL